jgi:hypothetical protein
MNDSKKWSVYPPVTKKLSVCKGERKMIVRSFMSIFSNTLSLTMTTISFMNAFHQGSLTEMEGSVQFTSLY